MAKRYEDRYGRGSYRRDRERSDDRGFEERGYTERAGDEVRSWFGDDDAQRRRHMDEQRDRMYGRQYQGDWDRSNWNRSDPNRSEWQRSNWNPSNWDDRAREAVNRPENWRGSSYDRDFPRGSGYETRGAGYDNRWTGTDSRSGYDPRGTQTPARPYSGRDWSVDEGRTEFGQQRYGRGPKGYQRSDNRILEDVCDRLTYSEVDAGEIEVSVNNGEVTLGGTVHDRWDKRRAEDIAEEVSGVRDVHNNIRVHRGERSLGQSELSASDQPGTVLGINPTASSTIANNERPKVKS